MGYVSDTPYLEVDVHELPRGTTYRGLPDAEHPALTTKEYALDLDEEAKSTEFWSGDWISSKLGMENLVVRNVAEEDFVTITFKLRVKVRDLTLVYLPPTESDRHVYGQYYTSSTDLRKVIGVKDFEFQPVGEMDYGFVDFVSNLNWIYSLRFDFDRSMLVGTRNFGIDSINKRAYVTGLHNPPEGECLNLASGHLFVADCNVL